MKREELKPLPTTVQYIRALTAIEQDITVHDRELLAAHWSFPEHAATTSELAHAIGMRNYGAVNLRYGRLGVLLRRELNFTRPGIQSYVISEFERRVGDGHWILYMRPQVAAALERLGWVRN